MMVNNHDTLIFSNPNWKDKEMTVFDNDLDSETVVKLIKYFAKVNSIKFFLDEEAIKICTLQNE